MCYSGKTIVSGSYKTNVLIKCSTNFFCGFPVLPDVPTHDAYVCTPPSRPCRVTSVAPTVPYLAFPTPGLGRPGVGSRSFVPRVPIAYVSIGYLNRHLRLLSATRLPLNHRVQHGTQHLLPRFLRQFLGFQLVHRYVRREIRIA